MGVTATWALTSIALHSTSPFHLAPVTSPNPSAAEMQPLGQQVIRSALCARYTTHPSFIPVRHLAFTRPTYESSQRSSAVSDHSAESYFKDVDHSPPPDTSTYQVDGSSEAVQRPHKPPSGEYSRAGVTSESYKTVDKREPYDVPSPGGAGAKLRYGGKGQLASEKGRENSEGPEGASAVGRKPEGKK